jgi:RNA polymerase sigma-70 factor, ECF subfamily
METGFTDEMHEGAKAAWAQFLDLLEPFRPALARYCRRLTGDIWDAEDLVHDTLLRGFGLLGSVYYRLENPQAYLLRIATNLWIDAQRRRGLEAAILGDAALQPSSPASAPATQEDAASVRQAGALLLRYLAPQERAELLLKDVFDMSLDETASILGTTSGAVKAALHRGRGRLKEIERTTARPAPSATVVDQFVDAYNARDLSGLLALMLDSAPVEMTGVNNEFGREGFGRDQGWFFHTVIGFPGDYVQPTIRWERREFRGEPLIVQLTTVRGREVLTSLIRLDTEGGMVARLRCYTFCPDAIREVASELGETVGPVFYSFPPFRRAWDTAGKAE